MSAALLVPNATCENVKPGDGVVLSKKYVAKLDWMLNSVDLPLGLALCMTVVITIFDTVQNGALSPVCLAVLLLSTYLFGYRYVLSTDLADVTTTTGTIFHNRSVRILGILPYIYIFVHMHLMKDRTPLAIFESWVIIPMWLTLLMARDWREAITMLVLHFVLHVPMTDVPNSWACLANLFMMDCMLVTAAWVKGQLVYIVRRILELQNDMHVQLQTYEDSLVKFEKSQQQLGKSLLQKEVFNAQQELRLRTTTQKLREAESWAENMTQIAGAAVKLAESSSMR